MLNTASSSLLFVTTGEHENDLSKKFDLLI
jgi:hypothetical protein